MASVATAVVRPPAGSSGRRRAAAYRWRRPAPRRLAGSVRASASLSDGTPDVAPTVQADFLVIGSGIAGLTYALDAAEHGTVALVTKAAAKEGSTRYAQGGICAVLDQHDSVRSHVRDTHVAGVWLCDEAAVEVVCAEGAAAVHYLAQLGAAFTRDAATGLYHLAREGGHTHHRIVHAADATGHEIERALLAAVKSHPGVEVYEHHLALDLVRARGGAGGAHHCVGADAMDVRTGVRRRFVAAATMLASGGAGQVYPSTTNPGVATGDGLAMAFRAGATLSNMEFVQFHPTSLYEDPEARDPEQQSSFLVSEAVRGHGAVLLNAQGERFMRRYDDRLELAPRDVVARAIDAECKATGSPCAFLDISHRPAGEIREYFPNISAACEARGLDMTSGPIPVTPAAHYFCGGVAADLDGRTSIPGLFACGEVACTGLHGANRLASNSLLEGVVFARRAAPAAVAHAERCARALAPALRAAAAAAPREHAPLPAPEEGTAAARRRLQGVMWEAAGIVRSTDRLLAGRSAVAELRGTASALASQPGAGAAEHELRNLATVGALIIDSALRRKESRGLHYTTDYPEAREEQRVATKLHCRDLPRKVLPARRVRAPKAAVPLPIELPPAETAAAAEVAPQVPAAKKR
mmetsp:Transcript_8995/g.31329  ORF Transcript_8995/g.31329 Transcript_8995/m.31329 type:complete len:639 (+) Transcript_8995:265-2181(+)